ncbi:hypothetical protein [Flagellimonas sp.]|uniref:hypothetical protein n=1 Tax=Flagellimonas sp. TaxID=2058762 RepID=UPI003B5CA743
MNLSFKKVLFGTILLLMGNLAIAQSTCSTGDKDGEKSAKSCESKVAEAGESTSGCSPTACRGAKTKFGEAKVISNLRLELIDLKAGMEKSAVSTFDSRSYDIHGIIGQTDDESLNIIIKEVKIVEKEIAQKLNKRLAEFQLPDSKAKQIQYLSNRIKGLRALL